MPSLSRITTLIALGAASLAVGVPTASADRGVPIAFPPVSYPCAEQEGTTGYSCDDGHSDWSEDCSSLPYTNACASERPSQPKPQRPIGAPTPPPPPKFEDYECDGDEPDGTGWHCHDDLGNEWSEDCSTLDTCWNRPGPPKPTRPIAAPQPQPTRPV